MYMGRWGWLLSFAGRVNLITSEKQRKNIRKQARLSKATLEISYIIYSGIYTIIYIRKYSGIYPGVSLGSNILFTL